MNDRELLELAAKAINLDVKWDHLDKQMVYQSGNFRGRYWMPLEKDGDSSRLQVSAHINVRFTWCGMDDQYDSVYAEFGNNITIEEQIGLFNLVQIDENAATRRAIVRAAAEIGKAMP